MSAGVHICIGILFLCIIRREENGRLNQTWLLLLNFIYCGYMNVHRVFVQVLPEVRLIRELIGPPSLESGMLQKTTWYTVISNTECFNYELLNCINLILLWFIIAMLAWFLVVLPIPPAGPGWVEKHLAVDRCPLLELGLSVGWGSTPALMAAVFPYSSCCA